MSKAEQVALGTTLAGVNQYKVFSAVMTNFDTAIKATSDAMGSFGSATKENEKYMESLNAKIQKVRAELQKFILAENSLQNVFKLVLDVAYSLIKAFNNFGGRLAITSALIISLINTLILKWNVIKGFSIFKSVKEFAQMISTFLVPQLQATGITALFSAEGVEALNVALESLNINPYMIAIAAVVAAIAGIVYAVHKSNHALEEQQDKFNETTRELDDISNTTKGYEEKLKSLDLEIKNLTSTLDKLNEKQNELTEEEAKNKRAIEDKIKALDVERELTENLIRLEEERRKAKQLEADREGFETLHTSRNWSDREATGTVEILESQGYLTNEEAYGKRNKDNVETLKMYSTALKRLSDDYAELKKKKEQFEGTEDWTEEDQERLALVSQEYLELRGITSEVAEEVYGVALSVSDTSEAFKYAKEGTDAYEEAMSRVEETSGDIKSITEEEEEALDDLDDSLEDLTEEEIKAKELLDELGIKENALQKEIGMSSVELVRQAEMWNVDAESLYGYLKALNKFNESIDNLQTNYKTLSSAIEEYNEMGGYSIDTMQTLLKMSPEYLTMLDDELNGRRTIKEAITEKIKAQGLEAKAEIYNMAITRISNLATKENTESEEENAESFRFSVNDIDAQTNALKRNSQEKLNNVIASAKDRGATESEIKEIMDDVAKQIDIVDKAMLSLGKDFSSAMGSNTKSANGTNSSLKEQNNLIKEQKQLLEEKKKQYDTVVSYIKKKIQDEIKSIEKEKKAQVDAIKEQIDALKDLKKEELDRIQEQIDALKEQKSVEQEFWQNKIDALKEQNDELNTQLEYEELLENLAKAKSKRVRVYKEGQGFVYTEDTNEVDKAQAKVEEFQRKQTYEEQLKILENYKKQSENNYEDQIKALEKLKDEKEKNYEQQIKDLENYQKQIEDQYDARIAYFQSYLDKFTEQTDAYENEQNRQLAIQLTGIDFEQQGWQTRLDNLSNFVEKYNALLGDIHTLDTNGTIKNTTQDPPKPDDTPPKTTQTKKTETAIKNVVNKVGGGSAQKTAEWYAKNYGGKKASGDSSIKEDGFYLVGDSPNQELVIGSKLNGNLMNLTQGSGVVNASSTRTLAGMLNQLGFMGNQGVNMSNSQNKSTNITIGNISLPSVQNGKDFVDYLQNFSLQMTQEAFV